MARGVNDVQQLIDHKFSNNASFFPKYFENCVISCNELIYSFSVSFCYTMLYSLCEKD